MERMLRSRQEISEMKERLGIIPYMDRTLASNQRRHLQLVRALMKRDMVNLIETDEMRERVGVFLVEKPGKDTQRLIIGARVSNLHFLPPPGVSLVTSEGLSRVEVALENDDVVPGELSRLASLRLGLGCLPQIQDLETVQLLLCPCRSWEPIWLDVCRCFSSLPMGHTRSLFFCKRAIEEAVWATPSHEGHPELRDSALL